MSGKADEGEMAAVRREFDVDQSDPEVNVVKVIAELEGKDVADLSPLYKTIDHLIEELFSNPPVPEAQACLEFTYEGYRIVLSQDGHATFMRVAQNADKG